MPDGMPNASTSFVPTFESVGRENQFLSDTALGIQSVSLNDMGWGRAKFIAVRESQQVPHIAFHTFRLLRRAQKTEGTSKSVSRIVRGGLETFRYAFVRN